MARDASWASCSISFRRREQRTTPMSKFAGGVPLVWVVVMLIGAGLMAAASVLLSHRVSPVVVASLPLVAVGFWVILRYRIGALVLLLLSLPLGRLTLAEPGAVP